MTTHSHPLAGIETHGLFIDGREMPATSPALLDVRNPANGQIIARIAHADAGDVDRAVKSARAAFKPTVVSREKKVMVRFTASKPSAIASNCALSCLLKLCMASAKSARP